jgi:hypothetical protein
MWYAIDWALVLAALWFGRPPFMVALAIVGDLAMGGTGLMVSPYAIATVDLAAAIVCFNHSERGDIAAAIFVAMAVTCTICKLLAFPDGATYAIVDALVWLQAGVIGGLDTGIRVAFHRARNRANRPASGRRRAIVFDVEVGPFWSDLFGLFRNKIGR